MMATYSSRGPTVFDGVLKPELVAPGNRIVSAAAADVLPRAEYPERMVAGHGATRYMELSGTSMAAAVVSGAAALLLEAHPELTPAQVKLTLQFTQFAGAGAGLIEAGAGSLNVAAAVAMVKQGGAPTTTIAGETVGVSGVDRRWQERGTAIGWTVDKRYSWSSLAPESNVLETATRGPTHRLDRQHRLDQQHRLDRQHRVDR